MAGADLGSLESPGHDDYVPGRVKLYLSGYLVYLFERSPLPSIPADTNPRVAIIHGNSSFHLSAWVSLEHFKRRRERVPIQARLVIQRFINATPTHGKLVEGVFCWGYRTKIHVLTLLKDKHDGDRNRVVACVTYVMRTVGQNTVAPDTR
jgi:hypothetical protein